MSLLETLFLNLQIYFLVAPFLFHCLTFVFPLAESYYNSTTCFKVTPSIGHTKSGGFPRQLVPVEGNHTPLNSPKRRGPSGIPKNRTRIPLVLPLHTEIPKLNHLRLGCPWRTVISYLFCKQRQNKVIYWEKHHKS